MEPPKADPIPDLELLPPPRAIRVAEHPALRPPLARPGLTGPLAYLQRVVEDEKGVTVGPLWKLEQGAFRGDGLVRGSERIDALFDLIEETSAIDQARLLGNRFAATRLKLDLTGDGVAEDLFLTIEFPLDGEVVRQRVNPESGETERRIYEKGHLRRIVTARRVTEFVVDDDGVEVESRVFRNVGQIESAQKGELLEESRTTEVWFRDWREEGMDPRLPVISKVRVNYFTGVTTRETYGLFPQPVERIDGQYLTRYALDDKGQIVSAEVFHNGKTDEDLQRALMDRLLEPVVGELRYRDEVVPTPRELGEREHLLALQREDLWRGTTRVMVLDRTRDGRTILEQFAEQLPGAGMVRKSLRYHYRNDFHGGQVPVRTETRSGSDNELLSSMEVQRYDPETRRLWGVVRDHAGQVSTQLWDHRWEGPIEVQTDSLLTKTVYDGFGNSFESETVALMGRYPVASTEGKWEGRWMTTRRVWRDPGVILRTEQEERSAWGSLLRVVTSGVMEARPLYGESGQEVAKRHYLLGEGEPLLQREESQYRWREGGRLATVTTYLGGKEYDQYDLKRDASGRVLIDRMKSLPGLGLRTVNRYEGVGEKLVESTSYQNGEVLERWSPLPVQDGSAGGLELPLRVEGASGGIRTEYYALDNGSGWPARTVFLNGEQLGVTQSGGERVSVLQDKGGNVIERSLLVPTPLVFDGMALDEVVREVVGEDGERAVLERRVVIRGTDVTVFRDRAGARLVYDWRAVKEAPLYEMDPSGRRGVTITVGGVSRNHVTRLYESYPTTKNGENVNVVETVDLEGFFGRPYVRRTYDRSGLLLEEAAGRVPGVVGLQPERLFEAARKIRIDARSVYLYDGTGELDGIDVFRRQEGLSERSGDLVLEERLRGREILVKNSYLPEGVGRWEGWAVDSLGPAGTRRLPSEIIFDGQEKPVVRVTYKENARRESAERISYEFHRGLSEEWQRVSLERKEGELPLLLPTGELGDCHFLAVPTRKMAGIDRLQVRVRDANGHEVVVGTGNSDLLFWPGDGETVQWLPNIEYAQAAASVRCADEGVLLVSVPELAGAGINTKKVASVALLLEASEKGSIEFAPLQRLRAGRELPMATGPPRSAEGILAHGSGIQTWYPKLKQDSRNASPGYWYSDIRFAGSTIARVRPRYEASAYPMVVVQDPSGAVPRPLYALVAETGEFLEYYRYRTGETTELYTVASGFRPNRMETFRAGILEDEASPGMISYGGDYRMKLPLSRSSHTHNRVSSSVFKLSVDWLESVWNDTPTEHPELENARAMHRAEEQAAAIAKLPSLAAALLPHRTVPWKEEGASEEEERPLVSAPPQARAWLRSLTTTEGTDLLPTAPGTEVASFVDTREEARLIQLALKLGEVESAARILDFYWDKTRGGTQAVHDSYHLQTGASLQMEPQYERASEADRTAGAQLAIAESAILFARETGDSRAWELGERMVHLLFEDYRSWYRRGDPRGLAEQKFQRRWHPLGLALWPDPSQYSVETNSRALVLLDQARELAPHFAESADKVHREFLSYQREQRRWLFRMVLPHVHREGVVPHNLFEVQDLRSESSALAVARWTSTASWLAFLEAAYLLDVSPSLRRQWLDNLARVHGVEVSGVWGLDWGLALTREDAISSEQTAAFFRIAELLEHEKAARFVRKQLRTLGTDRGQILPVVVTAAAPDQRFADGLGGSVYPLRQLSAWPRHWTAYAHLLEGEGQLLTTVSTGRSFLQAMPPAPSEDVRALVGGSVFFYASLLLVALSWWVLHGVRRRSKAPDMDAEGLLSTEVMETAEIRWARRVVGTRVADGAPNSRFSDGPVEANFLVQLRTLYKLVLEWRRAEHKQEEEGALDLLESDGDAWINGADEFGAMVALYLRSVIKAGHKDGFRHADVLTEAEDSNHIWSRLVLCFSESYRDLVVLLDRYQSCEDAKERREINQNIVEVLERTGLRRRESAFDARELFHYPSNPEAFDLLLLQEDGVTLSEVVEEAEEKLAIPREHFGSFIERYKAFKHRENPYPIHPLVVEAGKLLPHFLLMALVGIIWYNHEVGGLPVVPFLAETFQSLATPRSLYWAVPLMLGVLLGLGGKLMARMRFRKSSGLARIRSGRERWDPVLYEYSGYVLRAACFLVVGIELVMIPAPSFAAFLLLKGVVASLFFLEAAAVLVPMLMSLGSRVLQERMLSYKAPPKIVAFLHQFNFPATRPASLIWQSLCYHFRPSVPSGGWSAMLRSILFYYLFSGIFLLIGGYVSKEVLGIWFAETYQAGADARLLIGAAIFVNTMYLMRFGLFVMLTSLAAAFRTWPLKASVGATAIAVSVGMLLSEPFRAEAVGQPLLLWGVVLFAMLVIAWEHRLRAVVGTIPFVRRAQFRKRKQVFDGVKAYREDRDRSLGLVYMSGDELSAVRLSASMISDRWEVLRERLDSPGARVLRRLHGKMSDLEIQAALGDLEDAERRSKVTLWHPAQVAVGSEPPDIPANLGLTIRVRNWEEKERLLDAWHIRRWIVTMMASAGQSQDTGVNLVDIALRLSEEGLAKRLVFYLIQNKYDGNDEDRPGQRSYEEGELGQREKLARLLQWAAPGCRAYSLVDWTPFAFKAGGLAAMDLVPEESLRLTNMVVMDRNATVHDLDGLVEDISGVLADPGVVNVIPGRGTTNTRTAIGQGSQAMEEGHRTLIRGMMTVGAESGEAVGTGWGNIQAIYYGRVQKAMLQSETPRLALTSRMARTSRWRERYEGMIGFAPHAIGISEDIWAVNQAAHSAIALKLRAKFRRSRAMWHKMRETWSHADWFSAFPRWSGGYVQMMQDPLMQRVNEGGSMSLFAKEHRSNNGRFFFSAPFALLSILLMPLAIMADASPFVQILVVLWNFGFIMNQVLTSLGLLASMEATGYSRSSATACAALAGGWSLSTGALPLSGSALLVILAFILGGFLSGLGRWLFYRGRDVILFGPQLVIFALGQMVRQGLEFALSGASANDAKGVNMSYRAWAGPREDRPWMRYANIVNLRSVVWLVGGSSLVFSLVALASLDFLNVLLLLPSLLFSVSCLVGPFLMRPKRGRSLKSARWIPRLLGWVIGFSVCLLIAGLVAEGGPQEKVALALGALFVLSLVRRGLRHLFVPRQLRRERDWISRRVSQATGADPKGPSVAALTSELLSQAMDPPAMRRLLAGAGATTMASDQISSAVAHRVQPLLERADDTAERKLTKRARFICETRRSLTLSIMTFGWFLMVPVPGLLVFTAGSFRFAFELVPFLNTLVLVVGAVLGIALAGRLGERVFYEGVGKRRLTRRAARAYRQFRDLEMPAASAASIFALFTELQTYLDQRAFGYAHRTLGEIEEKLPDSSS